jgi:hypothetical protein
MHLSSNPRDISVLDRMGSLVSSAEDMASTVVDRSASGAEALLHRPNTRNRRPMQLLLLVIATAGVAAVLARRRQSRASQPNISTPAGMSDELIAEAKKRSEV